MKLHQSIKPSTYSVSHHPQPLSRVLTLSAFTMAMVSLNLSLSLAATAATTVTKPSTTKTTPTKTTTKTTTTTTTKTTKTTSSPTKNANKPPVKTSAKTSAKNSVKTLAKTTPAAPTTKPTSRLQPSTSGDTAEFTPIINTPPNPEPVLNASPVTDAPSADTPSKKTATRANEVKGGKAAGLSYDPTINNGVPYPPSYGLDVPSNLTLAQAQQYLVKVSPKVAADNAAIVSNELRAESTKGLNKPIVYLGASATHVHVDNNIDTTGIKNNLAIDNAVNNNIGNLPITLPLPTTAVDIGGLITDPIPNSIPANVDKNRTGANVTVLWSAYNGHKTEAVTSLLNGMTDESRADADLSLDEQYTTLTKRYFQTQLAIMAAYLRADALNAIRATDHAAQRALDVGLISKVERLEAKKALADAEYENSKALNDAELAMTALQRLLRTPYFIKPTSPLFVSTKPLPPLSYFQQQAKMHHPGFDKVAAKYNQAKALHEFSESAYKPNVTVFGRSEIDADPNWIAGVSANWKLWGGVDRRTSTQSSLAKLHQAEFSQVDVNDNIMLLVEKNWQTVNNARDNFIALNTNIELASEMLRFRQLGFKEGVNTAVEVMQAEANLEKAKTEQAKAANDYVQAMADLMQSCGTPLEFNRYMQAADVKLPAIYFEHRKN